jgi:hypothetical protein
MGEKVYFSDSDHRFAYFLHTAKKRLGISLKDGDGGCDYSLISLSRKIKRTRGSWSLKVTNFDEIRDGGKQTGNAEKIYERFKLEWEANSDELMRSAGEELDPFNQEAKELFIKLGFPAQYIKDTKFDSKKGVYFEVIGKGDVKRAATKLKKDGIPEGFDDSVKFEVTVDSDKYPPKALMAYAYNIATGIKLNGADFKGGLNTPCFTRLESFGFKIEPKGMMAPSNTSYNQIIKMNTTTRLITSLASKPFVILAGGTGTGKTKCAIEVARRICRKQAAGEAADYEVVAVGADWSDTRPLLGYENILGATPSYTVPKALDLIIRASRNPDRPFFLILDEMNLSHVERYFSDFLSIMESKKIDTEASTIKLHANKDGMPSTDGNVGGKVEQRIQWPDNLFVIGTVNIDETTHMFSPKVLDRAHVIEFKPDETQITAGLKASWEKTADTETADELKMESEKGIWTDALSGMLFKENRVMKLRKSVDIFNDKEDDKNVIEKRIMDAWRNLSKTRFSFSHRTAQETADYIFISHRLLKENADVLGEPPALNDLVDLAFLQKILPKINGSAETLSVKADNKDPKVVSKETTLLDVLISEFKKGTELTRCIQKLEEMKTALEREHFVSFIQ